MKRFNIIDVIILLLIVCAICGIGFVKQKKGSVDDIQQKYIVTLEIKEKNIGFSKNVVAGDVVIEKEKKNELGTITGVYSKPAETSSYDRITGEAKTVTIPEREDVYVIMELNKNDAFGVGKKLSIVTKHFSGYGYVVGVEKKTEDK